MWSNQLFMKNGYDHHDHQDIYTYDLSVPKSFTLDVPNQSPPYSCKNEVKNNITNKSISTDWVNMRLENAWSRKRANKSTLTNLVKMWQERMGKIKKITNKSTSTKLGKNEVKGMGTGWGV